MNDRIDASDCLRQFCRHAFELRDWLLGADIDDSSKAAVRRLFGRPSKDPSKRVPPQSVALAACADIANATKHFNLDRASYSTGGHAEVSFESVSSLSDLPEFFRQFVDVVPRLYGEHQWMWIITINGKEHDALLLAEDAMKDWENCLVNAGLVRPEHYGWSYPSADDRNDDGSTPTR